MAKGQDIKRRIKSISSMNQVTKAMELISSFKMKKAQDAALKSKSYVFESWRSVLYLAKDYQLKDVIYLNEPKEGKILVLLITSDRGLAGSYSTNLLKKTLQFIEENGLENIDFITMGSKGRVFLQKLGANIVADFTLGHQIRFTSSSPIGLMALQGFESGKYKKFISIHTHFDSANRMGATSLQIIPFTQENAQAEEEKKNLQFKFEPNINEVILSIIKQCIRGLTYQVILESEAAEHASRMIAMKNASDAASDLKKEFELTYNQLRQASITAELAEISAGSNALE